MIWNPEAKVRLVTTVLLVGALAACTAHEEDACGELRMTVSDARSRQQLLDVVQDQVRTGALLQRDGRSAFRVALDPRLQWMGSGMQERVLTQGGAIGGVLIGRRGEHWQGIVVDVRSDRRVPLVFGVSTESVQVGYVCGARD